MDMRFQLIETPFYMRASSVGSTNVSRSFVTAEFVGDNVKAEFVGDGIANIGGTWRRVSVQWFVVEVCIGLPVLQVLVPLGVPLKCALDAD